NLRGCRRPRGLRAGLRRAAGRRADAGGALGSHAKRTWIFDASVSYCRRVTTVLCVPQWQGSASSGALRLMAGASRAAGLVPADAVVTVPVLETGGEKVAGVRAVDIAPIAAARARYGDVLTVLWIDAHPDVYSPQTLPSGAFHGMVVRALLGDGPAGLTPEQPLAPQQVIIAGERAGDVSEHEYLAKTGLRRHGVDDLDQVLDGLR